MEIKNRFTGETIWKGEAKSLREAVEKAVKDGANLTGADLARANLTGADLARANLTDANLTDADLTDANLTDANLTGADLARADLARANLTDADLTGARNAAGGTPEATSEDAAERLARRLRVRQEHADRYRARHPEVPVVERLDAKILAMVDGGQGTLNMRDWHTCETTHCRAGWAVTLAGAPGKALEEKLGSEGAGRAIYRASTGRAPYFYGDNETALADIRRCAAEDEVK